MVAISMSANDNFATIPARHVNSRKRRSANVLWYQWQSGNLKAGTWVMYRQQIGDKFKVTRGKVTSPGTAEWTNVQLDGKDRPTDIQNEELFLLPVTPITPRRSVTIKGECKAELKIIYTNNNPTCSPGWTVVLCRVTHSGHPKVEGALRLGKRQLDLYPEIGEDLEALRRAGMPRRWQAVAVQKKLGDSFKIDSRVVRRVLNSGSSLLFLFES